LHDQSGDVKVNCWPSIQQPVSSLLGKMSDPVTLASTCPLPNLYAGCDYQKAAPKKMRHIPQQEIDNVAVTAVAPYQAMPVAGPIITHNKATALAVLGEDDDLLPDVPAIFSREPKCRC
jgi:hypothetical protein